MANELLIYFITHYLLYILISICVLIGTGIGITYLSRLFFGWKKKEGKYLDKETIGLIESVVKSLIIVAMAFMVTFILNCAYSEPIELLGNKNIWDFLVIYVPPIYMIIVIVIVMLILVKVVRHFIGYLRTTIKDKPEGMLQPETLRVLELVLIYLIYGVGLLMMATVGLAAMGLSGEITTGIAAFFHEHLSKLLLTIVAILIIYGVIKFVDALVTDLKRRETRFSPHTLDVTKSIIIYILSGIAILIVILSVLSMTGLSQIGSMLLTTIIIVFGIIIAMAASRSVGNVLSGLIVMTSNPFENGDTVEIGDGIVGKVETLSIMFTRIITFDGNRVEVPNNEIMANKIINYTRLPVCAVEVHVGVGYEVPPERVHELLHDAVTKYNGPQKDDMVKDDAKQNENIPKPQIYTHELGEWGIIYSVKVYIGDITRQLEARSKLLNDLIDTFRNADVKIRL